MIITKGAVFDTAAEKGCAALGDPDEDGNFVGRDSDGMEVSFCTAMVVSIWPGSGSDLRPLAERTLADDVVQAPDGTRVRVLTIKEMFPPGDVPGGCACHSPGAWFSTAIFRPVDGAAKQEAEYFTREEAEAGHQGILGRLCEGRPLT